jgi:hypothetical protein
MQLAIREETKKQPMFTPLFPPQMLTAQSVVVPEDPFRILLGYVHPFGVPNPTQYYYATITMQHTQQNQLNMLAEVAERFRPAEESLSQQFVMEDRTAVSDYVKRHDIRGVLQDAAERLNVVFGRDAIKRLKLIVDDEGGEDLFCFVSYEGTTKSAMDLLDRFDEWWKKRRGDKAGTVIFDVRFA